MKLGYNVPLENTDITPLAGNEQVKQIFLQLKEKLKSKPGLIRNCIGLNKWLLLFGGILRSVAANGQSF